MDDSVNKKKCGRCGEFKPLSEFTKNKSRRDGLCAYCKTCVSKIYPAYKRAYRNRKTDAYVSTYARYRERILSGRHKYLDSRLELLWSLKTPCVRCGEDRKCSIHFHHINPQEKSVSLSCWSIGKARMLEESKKCICLCANCHEEFHYIYGHHPENPVEALQEYLKGEVENVT